MSEPPGQSPSNRSESSTVRPELTFRAVSLGIAVAAFVGAAYPYVVLKLGFGPNISVVSAFFGFIAISTLGRLFGRKGNRFEYNIVQTAGTSAGQAGFMVIVLAALDLLASRPQTGVHLNLSTVQTFLWLSIAGCLGVLLAVPLRRHYIDEEQLTFADGVAAGETLLILDRDRATAKRGVRALSIGGLVSGVHTLLRDGWKVLPESWFFGRWAEKLHVGLNWSLLSLASGMLIGMRVTLSMALGMVVAWYVGPPWLFRLGLIDDQAFGVNLRWMMWPAVGLMVSGGITALCLRWRVILKTLGDLRVASVGGSDLPIRFVVVGSLVLATALVVLQKVSLGLSAWLSILAILISLPLMLVGTRVLGETNWAPISSMANLVQLVFAVVSPGSASVNLITSGMSGTVAANGEHLMQDYKAGKLIGSNNRYLTLMQLIAIPVGAIAVAWIYPILRSQHGIGPDRYGLDPALAATAGPGFVSPASVRWAGFAEVLAKGIGSLPRYSLHAFVAALLLGIVLSILETKSQWVPSPTSVGLGMLIEAQYVLPMVLGGILQWVWHHRAPKQEEELNLPLSSGLIVGEALAMLGITLLVLVGVLKA